MSDGEHATGSEDRDEPLPESVLERVERLTRLARGAIDENEAEAYRSRRERRLAAHDYVARVREDDGGDVLVCHPASWTDDGVIRTDRIEDLTRAVEIPLEGAGDPEDWDALDSRNRELVAAVRADHGDVHGDNAAALADFAGNHYAKPIEALTHEELEEFLTEYVPRNAWPSREQRAALERSVQLVFEAADSPSPRPEVGER